MALHCTSHRLMCDACPVLSWAAPLPPSPCTSLLQKKTGDEMANFYADLCSKYPIISIEVRAAFWTNASPLGPEL